MMKNAIHGVQRDTEAARVAIESETSRVARVAAQREFRSRFSTPLPIPTPNPAEAMPPHEQPVLDVYNLMCIAEESRDEFGDVISVLLAAIDKQSVPAARMMMINRNFHAALREGGNTKEATCLQVLADCFEAFDKVCSSAHASYTNAAPSLIVCLCT
eukprot:SAG25_NODE_380_length_8808_cov_3.861523_8_plen_158_part_00